MYFYTSFVVIVIFFKYWKLFASSGKLTRKTTYINYTCVNQNTKLIKNRIYKTSKQIKGNVKYSCITILFMYIYLSKTMSIKVFRANTHFLFIIKTLLECDYRWYSDIDQIACFCMIHYTNPNSSFRDPQSPLFNGHNIRFFPAEYRNIKIQLKRL